MEEATGPVEKQCSKCKQSKPRDQFPPSKQTADGLFRWCRPCKRGGERASYRGARGEEKRARARAAYAADPEVKRERERERYADRRDQR